LGEAYGDITGYVVFNCATVGICASSDFKVKTDWVSTPSSSLVTPQGGGGGDLSPFGITIDNGSGISDKRNVSLTITKSWASSIMISNFTDFRDGVYETYSQPREWDLCSYNANNVHPEQCSDGVYTVFIRFFDQYRNLIGERSASVTLRTQSSLFPILLPTQPLSPLIIFPPTELLTENISSLFQLIKSKIFGSTTTKPEVNSPTQIEKDDVKKTSSTIQFGGLDSLSLLSMVKIDIILILIAILLVWFIYKKKVG